MSTNTCGPRAVRFERLDSRLMCAASKAILRPFLFELCSEMRQFVAGRASVPLLEFVAPGPRVDVHDLRKLLRSYDVEYLMRCGHDLGRNEPIGLRKIEGV